MRKILIGFLIVLLVIMAYLMIFKGLELGDFKVLSASQIVEENDRLRREIDTLKKINFALKKDIDDLHAKLIHERYENLYPSTGGQDMETE